ncbi:phosphatidylglycerolphosphate synthase [Scheffersomyces coipomensis]|uniref:phosphatidylglycerolphosphate synthase n=1 Tax=Scheffersomyces coipomensis TaxID=1788519 RepID=UPI00315D8372
MISSVYNYLFSRSPANPNSDPNQTSINQTRSLSTNNKPLNYSSFHPNLKPVFQQLDSISPRFIINPENITILNDPKVFYKTLITKISTAKSRVFLTSLYMGKTQYELIEVLDKALSDNEDLKIDILTDALRGTRESPEAASSATLLLPLVEKFGQHRINIRFYHTPHLSGLIKSITPRRINEGWGLQHMKLYGFDNEIMLSGANLSNDYFNDRQDRYYIFKDQPLTDYYYNIQAIINSLSYQLLPSSKLPSGFKLSWPTSNKSCEPHLNLHRFIQDSSYLLDPILKQHNTKPNEEEPTDFDTVVYPISQFTPLFPDQNDRSTEKPAILRLLAYLDSSSNIKWWFTAGYFNMLPQYQDKLLNSKHSSGTVITASPKANSFYKSSGVSYYLPQAYLLFAKRFLEQIQKLNKQDFIKVFEWENGVVNTPNGWSYHAKGIWITTPDDDEPSMTIIGSSNYTKRAYSLDLESNAVIITKNPELKKQMKHEIDNLLIHAKPLRLADFNPKPINNDQPIPEKAQAEAEERETTPTVYQIDEDKKISYGVHLLVRLLGGKM